MSAINSESTGLSRDLSPELRPLVDRFEDAWQSGQRPRIEVYLPPEGPERRTVLIELIHVDLERRLKSGEAVRVEHYLERYPEVRTDQALVLKLLVSEFALRRRSEPNLSPEGYVQRFPSLGEALRARLGTDHLQPSSTFATVRETAVPPPGPGDRVASPGLERAPQTRYRVLRFHAGGALGEVHVAEDTELHRHVALKRIKAPRAHDPESQRRFLQEAEVTARLEHPGVVPVYGLVRDAQGQPNYAMRFIDGHTLAHAIRSFHESDKPGRDAGERNLALRELLGQFMTVCKTVAYAHSRGIVHRDIKPGNIMLGKYGETLVVDWGLAKPFERSEAARASGEQTLAPTPLPDESSTRMGQALGTPAYMSPEQAAGELDLVGPASDIYSLGATLYHLLTGRPAHHGEGPWRLRIQRGEFLLPRQRNKEVPLPLEAVCLKAMALEMQERYATALELAADIEHWLADEPMAAYKEPWLARLGRWGRRHRAVVAAAAGLLLTTLVALSVGTVLIRQREQEARATREVAEQQRQRAEQQRDRADGNFRLARDAVDSTVTKIADNPLLKQANFHQLRQELLQYMVPFYEKFVEQEENDPDVAEERGQALSSLAGLRKQMGQMEKARIDYEQVRAIFAQLTAQFPDVPKYRLALAATYNHLGAVLRELRMLPDTERAFREALQIRAQLVQQSPDEPRYRQDLATSHNSLGAVLDDRGKRAEAEIAFRDALKIQAQLVRDFPDEPKYRKDLARSYNNLGWLLHDLGKRVDAESAYREALKLRAQLAQKFPAEPDYRQDLARTHNRLGALLADLGKRHDAETAYRDALRIRAQLAHDLPAVPQYRQELAASYNDLGLLLRDLGREDEAETTFREALQIRAQLVQTVPDVPYYRHELAAAHNDLGNLLRERGKREEAETAYRAALKIQVQLVQGSRADPEFHQGLGNSYNNLGDLLRELERRDEAMMSFRQALKIQEKLAKDFPTGPEFRHDLATTDSNLGKLLRDLGKRAEAEDAFNDARRIFAQLAQDFPAVPAYRNSLAGTMGHLATLFRRSKEPDAARRTLEEALPHHKAALQADPDNRLYRESLRNNRRSLAEILVELGEHALAADTISELIQVVRDPANDLYHAACLLARCAPLAERDSRLSEGQRKEHGQAYIERAMATLRQAVESGYKDTAHMKKDSDLDPLRSREDFHVLLRKLEPAPKQ